MGIFSFFTKQKDWFTPAEHEAIVNAIRASEKRTSGEIRVFIESRCSYVDPVDRAVEVFFGLKMEQTEDRNGVLLYIAMKDHQLAVFGDKGIHEKVGTAFWNNEVRQMLSSFGKQNYAEGIVKIITDIGDALVTHFPYENEDRNELPDDIVFGR
ncbi:TPM domain-containing protein [Lacibacter sediminis]|uniref:TPM domain-containing protein n=1 Tax=Lacibacter sediminis TaxID=2760713 RepID=A0A7G5XIN0_9BACT|nr:TPM domain-containing protein [Lacibacter sediminis]QNA45333.1 TPM domain-containing protein [Lacibacter sediminis]